MIGLRHETRLLERLPLPSRHIFVDFITRGRKFGRRFSGLPRNGDLAMSFSFGFCNPCISFLLGLFWLPRFSLLAGIWSALIHSTVESSSGNFILRLQRCMRQGRIHVFRRVGCCSCSLKTCRTHLCRGRECRRRWPRFSSKLFPLSQ